MLRRFTEAALDKAKKLVQEKRSGTLFGKIYKISRMGDFVEIEFACHSLYARMGGFQLLIENDNQLLPFSRFGENSYLSVKELDTLDEGDEVEIPYKDARVVLTPYGYLTVTVSLEGGETINLCLEQLVTETELK